MGHEHPGRRIDIPHESRPGSEPFGRLGRHRRGPVVRRKHFDYQIGRTGKIHCWQPAGETLATHEGHVGSPHGVGIAGENETRLGGKDLPEVSGLDVVGQQRRDPKRNGPMP